MSIPELKFLKEGKYGYLIEKEPIQVALVPAKRRWKGFYSGISPSFPLDYVVLPPQYVPKNYPGVEFVRVRGRRIGRTLDILLDEPVQVQGKLGKSYRIVTFKGAGAIESGTGNWTIDPYHWHAYREQLGRIWGGVYLYDGRSELRRDLKLPEEFGLPTTPYLFGNEFPEAVLRNIFTKGEEPKKLLQLVRVCETNIMPVDIFTRNDFHGSFGHPLMYNHYGEGNLSRRSFFSYADRKEIESNLLSFVETVAQVSKELYRRQKMLWWSVPASLIENMFISPELKDLENIMVVGCEGEKEIRNSRHSVIHTSYNEIMNNLARRILSGKITSRIFSSFNNVVEYICQNKGELIEGNILKQVLDKYKNKLYI